MCLIPKSASFCFQVDPALTSQQLPLEVSLEQELHVPFQETDPIRTTKQYRHSILTTTSLTNKRVHYLNVRDIQETPNGRARILPEEKTQSVFHLRVRLPNSQTMQEQTVTFSTSPLPTSDLDLYHPVEFQFIHRDHPMQAGPIQLVNRIGLNYIHHDFTPLLSTFPLIQSNETTEPYNYATYASQHVHAISDDLLPLQGIFFYNDPQTVLMQRDPNGKLPIHHAVELSRLRSFDLIAELCPLSLTERTRENESIIDLSLEDDQAPTLEKIFTLLDANSPILHMQPGRNTHVHDAVSHLAIGCLKFFSRKFPGCLSWVDDRGQTPAMRLIQQMQEESEDPDLIVTTELFLWMAKQDPLCLTLPTPQQTFALRELIELGEVDIVVKILEVAPHLYVHILHDLIDAELFGCIEQALGYLGSSENAADPFIFQRAMATLPAPQQNALAWKFLANALENRRCLVHQNVIASIVNEPSIYPDLLRDDPLQGFLLGEVLKDLHAQGHLQAFLNICPILLEGIHPPTGRPMREWLASLERSDSTDDEGIEPPAKKVK